MYRKYSRAHDIWEQNCHRKQVCNNPLSRPQISACCGPARCSLFIEGIWANERNACNEGDGNKQSFLRTEVVKPVSLCSSLKCSRLDIQTTPTKQTLYMLHEIIYAFYSIFGPCNHVEIYKVECKI